MVSCFLLNTHLLKEHVKKPGILSWTFHRGGGLLDIPQGGGGLTPGSYEMQVYFSFFKKKRDVSK